MRLVDKRRQNDIVTKDEQYDMSLFQAMIKQKDYSAANSEYKDVRFKKKADWKQRQKENSRKEWLSIS